MVLTLLMRIVKKTIYRPSDWRLSRCSEEGRRKTSTHAVLGGVVGAREQHFVAYRRNVKEYNWDQVK